MSVEVDERRTFEGEQPFAGNEARSGYHRLGAARREGVDPSCDGIAVVRRATRVDSHSHEGAAWSQATDGSTVLDALPYVERRCALFYIMVAYIMDVDKRTYLGIPIRTGRGFTPTTEKLGRPGAGTRALWGLRLGSPVGLDLLYASRALTVAGGHAHSHDDRKLNDISQH